MMMYANVHMITLNICTECVTFLVGKEISALMCASLGEQSTINESA